MHEITAVQGFAIKIGRLLGKVMAYVMTSFAMPKVFTAHRNVDVFSRDGAVLKMDIFRPFCRELRPIVMVIHGGGFVAGDKEQIERTCRKFCQNGFVVFNVNYRLSPEHPHPIPIQDCEDIFIWIKRHAKQYDGDPNRVCVAGASAGAYLASCLALKKQDSIDFHFNAALLLNGCFDVETTHDSQFPQAKFLVRCFLGDKFANKIHWYEASTVNFVNERFPKTFIAVGSKDSLLNQSHKMRDALQGMNIDVEYREYENSNHGWFSWFWTVNSRRAHQDVISWLKRVM